MFLATPLPSLKCGHELGPVSSYPSNAKSAKTPFVCLTDGLIFCEGIEGTLSSALATVACEPSVGSRVSPFLLLVISALPAELRQSCVEPPGQACGPSLEHPIFSPHLENIGNVSHFSPWSPTPPHQPQNSSAFMHPQSRPKVCRKCGWAYFIHLLPPSKLQYVLKSCQKR